MRRFLLTLTLLIALPLWAEPDPDTAPPSPVDRAAQRLAELRALPMEGRQLSLMTEQGEAFALFLPDSSGKRRGAVLLLPDTHKLLVDPPIEMLRTRLSRHGWDTLAVQLPEQGEQEDHLSWLDRSKDHIDAALAYLEEEQSGAVVLIGHGSGALLAIDWLFNTTRDRVLGLITLSLDGSANPETRLDAPRQLALVNVPVLDIYAMHDRPQVLHTAERRAIEAQRPPRDERDERVMYRDIAHGFTPAKGDRVHYRQLQIPSADHTYHPSQELLLRAVRGWLQRHTKAE